MPREELSAADIVNHPDPLDRPITRADVLDIIRTFGIELSKRYYDTNEPADIFCKAFGRSLEDAADELTAAWHPATFGANDASPSTESTE